MLCNECEIENSKLNELAHQKKDFERKELMKEKWFNEEITVDELLMELGLEEQSIGVLINGIKVENSTKIHTRDDVRIVLSDVKGNTSDPEMVLDRVCRELSFF